MAFPLQAEYTAALAHFFHDGAERTPKEVNQPLSAAGYLSGASGPAHT